MTRSRHAAPIRIYRALAVGVAAGLIVAVLVVLLLINVILAVAVAGALLLGFGLGEWSRRMHVERR